MGVTSFFSLVQSSLVQLQAFCTYLLPLWPPSRSEGPKKWVCRALKGDIIVNVKLKKKHRSDTLTYTSIPSVIKPVTVGSSKAIHNV